MDRSRPCPFGSASLLVSFPELGDPGSPLSTTYDADLCPEPFDELTGVMLDEALGENHQFEIQAIRSMVEDEFLGIEQGPEDVFEGIAPGC